MSEARPWKLWVLCAPSDLSQQPPPSPTLGWEVPFHSECLLAAGRWWCGVIIMGGLASALGSCLWLVELGHGHLDFRTAAPSSISLSFSLSLSLSLQ